MTNQEMRKWFLILYDRVTNFDAPAYTDTEVSEILTGAQEELVHHTYNPLGNKYKEGLEETEFSTADLQELVVNATLTQSTDQTGVLNNGVFFDLPDNHYLSLSETVTATGDCTDGKIIMVKPITHDEYAINKDNPHKKPNRDVFWRLAHSSSKFELIAGDGITISTYNMRYLKKPTPIIIGENTVDGVTGPQDCQLKDTTHRRIVSYAVRKASGITEPELYQLRQAEQQSGF